MGVSKVSKTNGQGNLLNPGRAEKPPVNKYEVLAPAQAPEMYTLLNELVKDHHSDDLAEARIALAWIFDVKPDRDDHLMWGQARKVGELERQFHDHDFVILLNFKVWNELPLKARRALLDHELSHCGRAEQDDGSSKYYVRKHDLEEFTSIVRRYGTWREDVEQFVNAALLKEEPTLFDKAEIVRLEEPSAKEVVIALGEIKEEFPGWTATRRTKDLEGKPVEAEWEAVHKNGRLTIAGDLEQLKKNIVAIEKKWAAEGRGSKKAKTSAEA